MHFAIIFTAYLLGATFVSYVAYRSGFQQGRREGLRAWVAQCHALITLIEINQKDTRSPMVSGTAIINTLNKFVHSDLKDTFFVPNDLASPFDADVIKPGDPGYDILERARRDGYAEGTVTAAEDAARQEAIDTDPLARLIHDFIEALPHHTRLYPDLYALDLAAKVRGDCE